MALAANKDVVEKDGKLLAHPVAVDIIYKGALVKHNAAGFLAPCAPEAGGKFAGVAYEKVDNSGGSAGDLKGRVLKEGAFLLTSSGLVAADAGKKVYAVDDETVALAYSPSAQCVGTIEEVVSSTLAYVKINSEVGASQKGNFQVVAGGEFTTVGGDASESIASVGVLASDLVVVTLHTVGTTPRTILTAVAAADAINVEMSADPAADHVLTYVVLRAI